MFKRFIKILSICLAGVIGGLVLMVGIAYLAGAFNEKIVEPEDIAFTESQVTTSTAINLKVDTTTEDVNRKTLSLSASPEGILNVPQYITIGEDFVVWPVKDAELNNVGGVVTLTASYNGVIHTQCTVFVDVPVERVEIVAEHNSLSKGESISFDAVVYPSRALNPGKLDLETSAFDREKTIYYALLDENGELLSDEYAVFMNGAVNKGNVITSKEKNSSTVIMTRKECNFYLKAYMFKTFEQEDKYADIAFESKVSQMLGAVSPAQDDNGQMIIVADVYIDSLTATNSSINTYWYESSKLIARKDGKDVDGFDLDIKLNPKTNTEGYDFTSLDYLMDNLTLEYYDGAVVTVTKDASFVGNDPSTWSWTLVPTEYQESSSAVTSRLKLSISYRTQEGNTATAEWFFEVNINIRPVSDVVVNFNNSDQIELNSDSEDLNYIELEKDMLAHNENGFIYNTYKYFDVKPAEGQSHSTFSLLKFYLPSDRTVTRPTQNGIKYKFTFEINLTRSAQQYIVNFIDGGQQEGGLSYYAWDSEKGAFSETKLDSIADMTGRFRVEGIYTKTTTDEANLTFQDNASNDIAIKNLKYYPETQNGSGEFSIYPYVKIGEIQIYTELNTDTLLITSNLAKLQVNGYGSFDLNIAVVVTSVTGNPVYDENGDYIQNMRFSTRIRVTNSVKDLDLQIFDKNGGTQDISGTIADNNLVLVENNQYYLYIKNGPNTAFEVLRQAYEAGNLKLAINVVNTQYVDSLGMVINSDSITVGSIVEDLLDSELVGYKVMLEINNVNTIELEDGTRTKLEFELNIWVEDSTFDYSSIFTVEDNVITTATIQYADESSSTKTIYAAKYSQNKVSWNIDAGNGNTEFLPENITFKFTGLRKDQNNNPIEIDATKNINFISNTSGFNLANLIYLQDGVVVLKNVPYYTSGVSVRIVLSYNGDSTMNSRYIYRDGVCVQNTYEDAVDEYVLVMYGFNIEYTPKSVANIEGEQGKVIKLTDYSDSSIKTKRGANVSGLNITDLVTFNYTETEYFSLNGINLTVKTSLTSIMTVDIVLTIGNNNFKTHSLTFKSPYEVKVSRTTPIQAPINDVALSDYISVTKGGNRVNTVLYSFNDVQLSSGDMVSDFVTISDVGELNIVNIPMDFELEILVQVFEGDVDKGTFSGNMIQVVNKYTYVEGEQTPTQYVRVGDNNQVLSGGDQKDINLLPALTDSQTVTDVYVTFDENSQEFMRVADQSIASPNRKIRALYIGEDRTVAYGNPVILTLRITFEDAGYTYITLQIDVLKNLFIEFNHNNIYYGQTGLQLNDLTNYDITNRDGQDISATVTMEDLSFSIDDNESQQYLLIETNQQNNEIWLKVKKDTDITISTYVTVTYKVNEGAISPYSISYTLQINVIPAM